MTRLHNYWSMCGQLLDDGLTNDELIRVIAAMDNMRVYKRLDDDLQFVCNELLDAFEQDMK
jgi:hypothetical protein